MVEAAIAQLLADGEIDRHARRVRRLYARRRDALVAELGRQLAEVVTASAPSGGLALWAAVAAEIDVDSWADRGPAQGVRFHTARRYSFEGARLPYLRLTFAALAEEELGEAVVRMARALRAPGMV